MCRVYESKVHGPRTRLCYRTGRQGMMLPGRLIRPGRFEHVGRLRRETSRTLPRGKPHACSQCGTPGLSRHNTSGVCSLCEDGK